MSSLIPTAMTPPLEMEERSPLGVMAGEFDYDDEIFEEEVNVPHKKTEEENDSLSKHEIVIYSLLTAQFILVSLILLWASFTP